MGELLYSSTRGGETGCTASEAVLKGLAKDGGLFMPERIPRFDFALPELKDASYQEAAYRVMRLLLTDYSEEELRACIEGAYDEKFDTPEIAVTPARRLWRALRMSRAPALWSSIRRAA